MIQWDIISQSRLGLYTMIQPYWWITINTFRGIYIPIFRILTIWVNYNNLTVNKGKLFPNGLKSG